MTTFTGLGGAAGFLGSGLIATGGGGGGAMTGFAVTTGAACLTGAADAWAGCDLLIGCVLTGLAMGCALTAGWGFAAPWPLEIGVEAAVLDILDTADFFGGTDICFL